MYAENLLHCVHAVLGLVASPLPRNSIVSFADVVRFGNSLESFNVFFVIARRDFFNLLYSYSSVLEIQTLHGKVIRKMEDDIREFN